MTLSVHHSSGSFAVAGDLGQLTGAVAHFGLDRVGYLALPFQHGQIEGDITSWIELFHRAHTAIVELNRQRRAATQRTVR